MKYPEDLPRFQEVASQVVFQNLQSLWNRAFQESWRKGLATTILINVTNGQMVVESDPTYKDVKNNPEVVTVYLLFCSPHQSGVETEDLPSSQFLLTLSEKNPQLDALSVSARTALEKTLDIYNRHTGAM